MGSWASTLGPGLAAALLVFSSQQSLATDVRPSEDRIAGLVRDLGAGSFIVRQRATRELTDLGIVARDALQAACHDPDAEVRVRARTILATVSESDFRIRLEAFAADYDGRQKVTLPGWEVFEASFGPSRT